MGLAGDDTLYDAGDDTLVPVTGIIRSAGENGSDIITAGTGADCVSGGAGIDTITTDAGDDRIRQCWHDLINGGDGEDWTEYSGSANGVTVSLRLATQSPHHLVMNRAIQLMGIENILGSPREHIYR